MWWWVWLSPAPATPGTSWEPRKPDGYHGQQESYAVLDTGLRETLSLADTSSRETFSMAAISRNRSWLHLEEEQELVVQGCAPCWRTAWPERGAGVASAIPVLYLPPPAHFLVACFALLWPHTSILVESGWHGQSLPTVSAPQSMNIQEHAL